MSMRIARVYEYGGPDVLRIEDGPIPVAGPGEVLVKVTAAAVSFYDIGNRRGDFADREYYEADAALPMSLGYQGGGTVEAVGPGVTSVGPGARVAWLFGSASYAGYVVVPEAAIIPVPDDIDLDQVAASVVQGLLAYKLTVDAYPVQPGDWVLVQSAAGGVGSLVSQMATVRGGRVIGVVGSEEKVKVAQEAGAAEVIVSAGADVAAEVRRITGGTGVRVVFDGVGKDAFAANLDSLAPRGYFVIYGQSSGFVPPFDLMTLQDKGSIYLHRWTLQHYVSEWPDRGYHESMFGWLRSGAVSVRIDRRLPLEEAAAAHEAVEQRRTAGRILLIP